MKRYYYDDSRYREDTGLAAWGLLVIPFMLLVLGLSIYGYFGQRNATIRSNQGLQLGVGGSAPTPMPTSR